MAYKREKKWVARRRRQYQSYYLGNFDTREQAEAEEKKFDRYWPPKS